MPRSTLSDQNNGRQPQFEAYQNLQVVLHGDEKALATYVSTQTLASYPIDKPTLYRLANMSLHRRAEAGETGLPKLVRKHWHDSFFVRFPSLQSERTKALERLRADDTMTEWL